MKKSRARRAAARVYELAAKNRRLQQTIHNRQHPPKREDIWICEFCEYEAIYGSPPVALIRQYEIKDRKARKALEERRRMLEKVKQKGRKNKKNAKAAHQKIAHQAAEFQKREFLRNTGGLPGHPDSEQVASGNVQGMPPRHLQGDAAYDDDYYDPDRFDVPDDEDDEYLEDDDADYYDDDGLQDDDPRYANPPPPPPPTTNPLAGPSGSKDPPPPIHKAQKQLT